MTPQLVERDAFPRNFLDESPEAVALVDEDARIIFVNAQTERLFGHSRDALVGRSLEVLVPEMGRAGLREGRFRGRMRDGTTIELAVSIERVQTPRGLFFAASLRDVTPRHVAPRETDELFRLAFEEAPIGKALVGLDGKFLRVNRSLCNIVGYPREELEGLTFQAITHPDDLRVDLELAGDLAAGKIPRYTLPKRYVRKDGSIVDVMLHGSVVRESDGRPLYFIAQVEDITERRRAEAALRRSEESFRSLVDLAPDAVFIADLDGRYTHVNEAACRMLGYAPEELVGKTIIDLIREEDVPKLAEQKDFLSGGGRVKVSEWLLRRKDGVFLPVEISAKIHPDGRWVAFVRDVSERRQNEAALRRSEANFRTLIDQAPDAVVIADLDGRYTHVNEAACGMLGYTSGELLGMTVADLILPEDLARLAATKDSLREEGKVHTSEWTLRRKDGSTVAVDLRAKIHPDGRWVAFMRDASERKRNEEALRRTEESLARAQRAAHLGTWDWDIRTNHVERSKELFAVFGLPAGGAAPRRWSLGDYIHPDDRERVGQVVDGSAVDGRPYTLEHRIIRPDGVERIVLQHGEPIVEDGRVVRVVGTLLDVTERRHAELELEATLGWLRAVFDNSPVGLLFVHGPGGSIEMNDRAKALLGRPIENVSSAAEVVLDANGALLGREHLPGARALRGEVVEWGEYMLRHAGGALVPVLAGAAPIRDASGNVKGSVVALQDISSAKELERLRAEWGSVVAHDLRQPLNVMVLQSQLLLRNEVDPDRRRSIERVEAAGQRLKRMIGDLMDLSRLDARRLELQCEPHDVVALVRDSADRFALEASERHVDVQVTGKVCRAYADPDRVAQILDNLLSNALKYGAPGTPIVVAMDCTGTQLTVAVTNEGQGIAPDELPLLFRRFQRAQGAKDARIKGVGLGLYIAHELVEAHGGRLTVESTPGATTTFRFTLPVAR